MSHFRPRKPKNDNCGPHCANMFHAHGWRAHPPYVPGQWERENNERIERGDPPPRTDPPPKENL